MPRGIRTPDPLIRSQILYPAELWAQEKAFLYSKKCKKKVEAAPRFELGVKELQSSALPLGYVALILERKTRFELATLALARRCSTTEPLPHAIDLSGGGEWI